MKIWRIGIFGVEKLEQVEVPLPLIGAHQVLIRVHAVSLNFRDLLMKRSLQPKASPASHSMFRWSGRSCGDWSRGSSVEGR